MPRRPLSRPVPPAEDVCSDAMRHSIVAARAQALRDLEHAEAIADHRAVAKARERVRQAQVLVNRYGLDR